MRVEAIKISDGFLIPMIEAFREIRQNKVLLDVQILDPVQSDEYAALDQLIGLCETKQTDASVNHDAIIYGRRDRDDFC
ncbi:MAG: hypothetical protein BWK80_56320 [Desulfobacteraceae bacterium IS3]|nr:MAG: hypothetical protein BWK80_56320 [Desulfobacteraceae bacterium IS3]HAO23106.1 hypothetical protein [Desulfobacteraceae bacterium]